MQTLRHAHSTILSHRIQQDQVIDSVRHFMLEDVWSKTSMDIMMERFTIHYLHNVHTATKKSMEWYAHTPLEMEATSAVGNQTASQERKNQLIQLTTVQQPKRRM